MRTICLEHTKLGDKGPSTKLENMFFGCSPSQVLYNLEVRFSAFMLKLKVKLSGTHHLLVTLIIAKGGIRKSCIIS